MDYNLGRYRMAAGRTPTMGPGRGAGLERERKRPEKTARDAAKNLEFEKAAQLRDKLYQLKKAMFGGNCPVET